jgi:hypothetical protein
MIKDSFLSRWTIILLISILFLLLIKSFFPGVWIDAWLLNATDIGFVSVKSLVIEPVYGIMVRSVMVGFLVSLLFYF